MASEGEAGSVATTEPEPGDGYGFLVSRRFFYGSIWNYIQYEAEERIHSSTKRFPHANLSTLQTNQANHIKL